MTAAFDPVALVTAAIATVSGGMSGIAVPALALGAGSTAVIWGWGYFRKLGKAKS